jgi:hypothetical protein
MDWDFRPSHIGRISDYVCETRRGQVTEQKVSIANPRSRKGVCRSVMNANPQQHSDHASASALRFPRMKFKSKNTVCKGGYVGCGTMPTAGGD